jgi:hypothetical protein
VCNPFRAEFIETHILHRDLLKAAPAAAALLAGAAQAALIRMQPFDYQGVRLLDSPWRRQAHGHCVIPQPRR